MVRRLHPGRLAVTEVPPTGVLPEINFSGKCL